MPKKQNINKQLMDAKEKLMDLELSEDSEDHEMKYDDASISSEAQNKYREEACAQIVKYLVIDETIAKKKKEHKEAIAELNKTKTQLEKFIIKYLEDINQDIIKIDGKGEIERHEKITRKPINQAIIKDVMFEHFKQYTKSDTTAKQLTELAYKKMEEKREVTTKVSLKRTVSKKKATTKKQN